MLFPMFYYLYKNTYKTNFTKTNELTFYNLT